MKKEWKKPFVKWVILERLMTDTIHCSGESEKTNSFQLRGTSNGNGGDSIFGEEDW